MPDYQPPPIPRSEEDRFHVLYHYHLLNSEPEEAFDDLVQLASYICNTPIALISLVDRERQWFQSAIGIDRQETPLDISFCARLINESPLPDLMVIPDATLDQRFAHHPLILGDRKIRFCAGVPLIAEEGQPLGTLCVLDRVSRILSSRQEEALKALGRQVVAQIQLRQAYDEMEQRVRQRTHELTVTNRRLQREIEERKRTQSMLEAERASLTEQVQSRTAALRMANAELARAARAKDEFLAAMSHELRTPLNTILGMSEALQDEIFGPINESQRSSLHSMEESGRHLLELVNDILDISKIEAGQLRLNLAHIQVDSICEASLRFVTRTAMQKQLNLTLDVDESVQVVTADALRLKQILVNLLTNAVKFTPQGGSVVLRVTGDDEWEEVRFSVTDTGIGIPKEQMDSLFKPFVQLDSALSRHYNGTGLGLSLVYRLTELHGGSVHVQSKENEGSTFTVVLPWSTADRTMDPSHMDDLQLDSPINDLSPRHLSSIALSEARPRILLADDNEANVTVISDYLHNCGYKLAIAWNGADALRQAKNHPPDLILMDVQMPEMDGLEAIRQIRADPKLIDVPIIALTALAMRGDRERCLAAGADEYISKPVMLRRLVERIDQLLSQKRPELRKE